MSRRTPARAALALTVVLAAGCQDYNFNPVGHCLIQPGTQRVTLANISTADVLFVVDDSGSMGAEQQKLATNFAAFINNLDATNAARAAAGLDPIDFHIAVTTTAVFWNYPPTTQLCRNDCPGAQGQRVCCTSVPAPARQAQACTPGVTTCPAGTTCGTNCSRLKGENYCCNQADGSFPAGSLTGLIPCSWPGWNPGDPPPNPLPTCGTFTNHYDFGACTAGVAVDDWPYPRGDFVSWSSGATVNPRVLHFDKSLYPKPASPTATHHACTLPADCAAGEVCVASISAPGAPKLCRASCTGTCPAGFECVSSACQPTNQQSFTSQELVNFFSGGGAVQGNVIAGTCGSGQEQALQAARLALEKASARQQKDTYGPAAGKVKTWDPATRTASSAAAWLHDNSKLVLVFIGDEDDCSSPEDASGGVVMDGLGGPGNDACVHDTQKRYNVVSRFVDYFMGLGRPIGAAFIESAKSSASDSQCSGLDPGSAGACFASTCCQPDCPTAGTCGGPPDQLCGGQAAGTRLVQAASELGRRGADVVVGSICDPNFGDLLDQVAEIVKPPAGLSLPSRPAESAITLLRIADASGQTRKVCGRPLPPRTPTNYTLQEAQDKLDPDGHRYDWWFADPTQPNPALRNVPLALSQYIYINPKGSCIANPGETYAADYLGRIPEGGCLSDTQCRTVLGGQLLPDGQEPWTCYAGVDASGACVPPTAAAPGTCLCGPRHTPGGGGNCP